MRICGLLILLCVLVGCGGGSGGSSNDQSSKEKLPDQFKEFEALKDQSLELGWGEDHIKIGGIKRYYLWKEPAVWERGAIIVLHGGGGSYVNFTASSSGTNANIDFTSLAIDEGFAVFCLDSTWNEVTDSNGDVCGKRWDCMAMDRPNIDLPFIEAVIAERIPGLRPDGANEHVFITGHSNGGYMATLAASHYPHLLTGLAPVACGDPYGTFMDMSVNPEHERELAPGVFKDRGSGKIISEINAAGTNPYANEAVWPANDVSLPFKQFYHKKDAIVDLSCILRATHYLEEFTFVNHGAYALDSGLSRSLFYHYWLAQYNQPILDFFISLDTATVEVLLYNN